MKRWNVKGVDRVTGKDRYALVEADNESDAAKVSGLAVESVSPAHSPQARTPARKQYESVALIASIISGLGWASIAAGFLIAVIANQGTPTVQFFIVVFFGVVAGIFQIAVGSFIHMARDTAMHIQSK